MWCVVCVCVVFFPPVDRCRRRHAENVQNESARQSCREAEPNITSYTASSAQPRLASVRKSERRLDPIRQTRHDTTRHDTTRSGRDVDSPDEDDAVVLFSDGNAPLQVLTSRYRGCTTPAFYLLPSGGSDRGSGAFVKGLACPLKRLKPRLTMESRNLCLRLHRYGNWYVCTRGLLCMQSSE
jgi:hypothetical protein